MGGELLSRLPWRGLPLALAAGLALAGGTGAGPADPRPLAAVEVRLDAEPAHPLELERLIALEAGRPLDERAVRRTLSNLLATGLFEDASVSLREEAAGPVAVVALWARAWVERLTIEGASPKVDERELRRLLPQQEGAPLDPGAVAGGAASLRRRLVEAGFRRAGVETATRPTGPKRVEVVYRLAPGERYELDRVVVRGLDGEADLAPYGAEALAARLRSRPGDAAATDALADDAKRLAAWLEERGHLEARVEGPQLDELAAQAGAVPRVTAVFSLEVGPAVEVVVVGAEARRLRKRGLLSDLETRGYDEALRTQTCERIVTDTQRRGHYRAAATCVAETLDDGRRVRVTVTVDPGPKLRLREIRFKGNLQHSDEELLARMTTSPRRWVTPGSGVLVDADLEADLANLRSFYLLDGYSDVEIGPADVEQRGDGLILALPIREGRRRRAVGISFSGLGALTEAEVAPRLPLQPGGPFHPLLLDEAVNVLRGLYEEKGYPDATVTPQLDWDAEKRLVDVRFDVAPGEPARVDRVVVRGNHRTRPAVVRRVIGLAPGDPLSRSRLLAAERDLYRLGIFRSVDVEPAPVPDESGGRDVVVELEEGRLWRLAYGLSYHSDDGFGGLVTISRGNVGGRAQRFQLDLRANERDARYRLLYDVPSLGGAGIPLTFSALRQRQERESFTVDDFGVQLAATRDLSPSLRLGLVYDYRLVELSDLVTDPTTIDRRDRDLQISSLTPTLVVDRRDDPLDPTRGWSASLQVEWAFPLFAADTELVKGFWQQTQLLPLGRAGVVAASLRLGAIEPLDAGATPDPLVPDGLPSRLVPPSERFFAGGRTTHRAYERDRLGIEGETLVEVEDRLVETGGDGLALLNLDYRFPIAGAFGGTLFVDVGNVWADWRAVDLGEVETGVGVGFRYRSPIGPLRLDVGWALDPREGERRPVFFFSFGNPF